MAGTTAFEDLITKVYPDLLEVNHNTHHDRGILVLAPTINDNTDKIYDT